MSTCSHINGHINGCNNARLISVSSWAFPGLSEFPSFFYYRIDRSLITWDQFTGLNCKYYFYKM